MIGVSTMRQQRSAGIPINAGESAIRRRAIHFIINMLVVFGIVVFGIRRYHARPCRPVSRSFVIFSKIILVFSVNNPVIIRDPFLLPWSLLG
jgi:hypothetical protein